MRHAGWRDGEQPVQDPQHSFITVRDIRGVLTELCDPVGYETVDLLIRPIYFRCTLCFV